MLEPRVQREASDRKDDRVVRLFEGLPIERIEAELRSANRVTDVGNRTLAFYLHDMQERGLHHLRGFANAAHFAENRLAMSRRQAQELIAAGRALRELVVIDEAFGRGELGWTKVRLLIRVAVPENESQWVEQAKTLSTRRLERLVRMRSKGDAPRGVNDRGVPTIKLVEKLRLAPLTHELWQSHRTERRGEDRPRRSSAATWPSSFGGIPWKLAANQPKVWIATTMPGSASVRPRSIWKE